MTYLQSNLEINRNLVKTPPFAYCCWIAKNSLKTYSFITFCAFLQNSVHTLAVYQIVNLDPKKLFLRLQSNKYTLQAADFMDLYHYSQHK